MSFLYSFESCLGYFKAQRMALVFIKAMNKVNRLRVGRLTTLAILSIYTGSKQKTSSRKREEVEQMNFETLNSLSR